MPKKPLILIGGGGHCKSCIGVIESTGEWEIKGILDGNISRGAKILGYEIIGNDTDIDELNDGLNQFFITVGQIKSAETRKRIYKSLKSKGATIATIVSDKASVSKHVTIGAGTIIHHFCIINADVVIGENNIINTAANIEHDVNLGDNNHISTGAILNGNIKIGNDCFIGSGTIIANGVSIADEIVVGAGSLIFKNIELAGIYAGSPVKMIKNG
ncbi:acetyltransferase [Mucilaginibacter sp.]|uniref:acetyltransferase n=1 Tax=Mucilaginibacter sp. TaxID=1882438 RepID=UPI0025E66C8F|nr:acetyltransferase [Mucilaginibacter sp.]